MNIRWQRGGWVSWQQWNRLSADVAWACEEADRLTLASGVPGRLMTGEHAGEMSRPHVDNSMAGLALRAYQLAVANGEISVRAEMFRGR